MGTTKSAHPHHSHRHDEISVWVMMAVLLAVSLYAVLCLAEKAGF